MPIEITGRLDTTQRRLRRLRPRERRFSLTYSQEAGWDEPDAVFLEAIREEAEEITEVPNVAVPSEPAMLAPTVDSEVELFVLSTLMALADNVTTTYKIATTPPIGERTIEDLFTPEQLRHLVF